MCKFLVKRASKGKALYNLRPMNKNDIPKILESLDDWEGIKASPYFSSRVLARWENLQEERAVQPFWQLWWKPAVLLLATAFNLFFLFALPNSSTKDENLLKAFQEEYQSPIQKTDEINLYTL